MTKKLLWIRLFCFLLVFWVLPLPGTVLANNEAAFSLQLSTDTPSVGSDFQVTVSGVQLNDLYAFEISLQYDTSRLQFKKAKSGTEGYAVEPLVQANSLRLAFTLVGAKPGLSGNKLLYTLTFTSIGTGAAEIRIDSIKLVNSQLVANSTSSDARVVAIIDNGQTQTPNPAQGPTQGPTQSPKPSATPNPTASSPPNVKVINPQVNMDESKSMITSSIDSETWDQALKEAKAIKDGRTRILIQIENVPSASAYTLVLPRSAYSEGDEEPTQIELVTSFATLIVYGNMLGSSELSAGSISLQVGLADKNLLADNVKEEIGNRPVLELSLHAGDQKLDWNNPKAPVTVRIPYTPTVEELQNPELIVVWFINGEGQVVSVPNGSYNPATGMVSFQTTHFSTYAVSYVKKTFDDTELVKWAKKSIEVLAAKGIVNGTSEHTFNPIAAITRADFLVLLVRTLELQGTQGVGFSDVEAGAYYAEALRIAREHGIATGIGNNRFDPHAPISRQDIMTMAARGLQAVNRHVGDTEVNALSRFDDTASISSYAVDSVAMLVKLGLVHGDGRSIHPRSITNRAESAVMMYNVYHYLSLNDE